MERLSCFVCSYTAIGHISTILPFFVGQPHLSLTLAEEGSIEKGLMNLADGYFVSNQGLFVFPHQTTIAQIPVPSASWQKSLPNKLHRSSCQIFDFTLFQVLSLVNFWALVLVALSQHMPWFVVLQLRWCRTHSLLYCRVWGVHDYGFERTHE